MSRIAKQTGLTPDDLKEYPIPRAKRGFILNSLESF
jgi:hypothetical protein